MSLKSSELRIGNFVYGQTHDDDDNEQECVCEVIAIDSTVLHLGESFKVMVKSLNHGYADNFEQINGIPLTEEWLTKFGYALLPWGWRKEGSPLICFSLKRKTYWVELSNGFRIELPYVHTLQNFIALTGEFPNVFNLLE